MRSAAVVLAAACGSSSQRAPDGGAPDAALAELALSIVGDGSVQVSDGAGAELFRCPTTCSREFAPNTVVRLAALHTGLGTFLRWGGDCHGGAATTDVRLDGDRGCTAIFTTTADGGPPGVLSGVLDLAPLPAALDPGAGYPLDLRDGAGGARLRAGAIILRAWTMAKTGSPVAYGAGGGSASSTRDEGGGFVFTPATGFGITAFSADVTHQCDPAGCVQLSADDFDGAAVGAAPASGGAGAREALAVNPAVPAGRVTVAGRGAFTVAAPAATIAPAP